MGGGGHRRKDRARPVPMPARGTGAAPAGASGPALMREARMVALVIAVTVALWLGAQWLGGRLGWDASWVFLFDLAALAAFFWAMVVIWRLWRRQARQDG